MGKISKDCSSIRNVRSIKKKTNTSSQKLGLITSSKISSDNGDVVSPSDSSKNTSRSKPAKKKSTKTPAITNPNNQLKSKNQPSPPKIIVPKIRTANSDIIETFNSLTNVANNVAEVSHKEQPIPVQEAAVLSAHPIISTQRYVELVSKADRAIIEGKTFSFRHNQNVIRDTFTKRGWIELSLKQLNLVPSSERTYTYEKMLETLPTRDSGECYADFVNRCERHVLSCLIEHKPVKLIWSARRNRFDFACRRENSAIILNKLVNAPFATKGGILQQFENLNWVWENGVAEVYFPRSYAANSVSGSQAFVDNFKSTACISFLKFVVIKSGELDWTAVFQENGDVPFSAFEFALRQCYVLLSSFHNNNIDFVWPNFDSLEDWRKFFAHHRLLTRKDGKINAGNGQVEALLKNATILLESLKTHWPQYDLDGYNNVWIVKPSLQNCGRGLVITSNFEKIQNIINKPKRHDIIQKYIERPLLIHKTKFDIRQWFLITNVKPLVIWMYKENYLRFSSQVFDLQNLHESVHLTNHCIQRKYAVSVERDARLPKKNMWDSHTFQAYLRQVGQPTVYLQRIYPGLKKAIVATLLASQATMIDSGNSFELFGADFVISEDFTPWLLEINSCPDLARTTNVTSRMVPAMLEDLLKVVIDRRDDEDCKVGKFELIYKQNWPPSRTSSSSMGIKTKPTQTQNEESSMKRTTPLSENPDFEIKGKTLPCMDLIHRELYAHLVNRNSSKKASATFDPSQSNLQTLIAQKVKNFCIEDQITTLLHFDSSNKFK